MILKVYDFCIFHLCRNHRLLANPTISLFDIQIKLYVPC
nr:MAG TPA: hypothetical protein [Caudoviricetes sp.]